MNTESNLPTTGRLVGIDFGTVRIGIAICDKEQQIASPLEVYHRRSEKLDEKYFTTLISEEQVCGFVVGLPVHMSGDESEKSLQARAFGQWINKITDKPVCFYDERLSTALAHEMMADLNTSRSKKKSKVDKIAAQVILSSYLESSRTNDPPSSLES